MINLARNRPLAFVVGAAGFLGSHLTEELLAKNIQVVGVDDFSTGFRDNLDSSTKDKNFHLINRSMVELTQLEVPRLDYAFFVIDAENSFKYRQSFSNFLKICQGFKPRIVLVSSIDLYDTKKSDSACQELKMAEKDLAEYAAKEGANARVVRLATVFGSRMHFRDSDPLSRLIQAAAKDDIQKESTPLDFTSRAIFVDDAVNLLIKAIMHGATSQKIYDGALLNPVKTAEIKQVLLDPLWHEEKGFIPTELPPWPTPNLLKTTKELSWRPNTSLVKALKETLKYFRENPDKTDKSDKSEDQKTGISEDQKTKRSEDEEIKKPKVRKWRIGNKEKIKNWILVILCLLVLSAAIIYPLTTIVLAGWSSKNFLSASNRAFISGDYDIASSEIGKAKNSFGEVVQIVSMGEILQNTGLGKKQWLNIKGIINLGTESIEAVSFMTVGGQKLSLSLQIISGEKEGSTKDSLQESLAYLDTANKKFEKIIAWLNDPGSATEFKANLGFLGEPLWNLVLQSKGALKSYQETNASLKMMANVLSQILPSKGTKNYLVVWQDNSNLRPGGGVVTAVLELTFTDGKLAAIKEVNQTDLSVVKVEAPAEIRTDLKKNTWEFKDTSTELDFPASAKLMSWYMNRQTGHQIEGVIALDSTAIAKLLESMGPVETSKEGSPLSLANQEQTLKTTLNRVFFLPKKDWPNIIKVFAELKNQKHLMFYASDPTLFAYLKSENLTASVPRDTQDFLAVTETNLKEDGLNQSLKKEINLDSTIKENGGVDHRLNVKYSLPKGSSQYQSKVKIYLPQGAQIKTDKNFSSFSDYGKSGLAYYLTLNPGETKEVAVQYTESKMVQFINSQASYSLALFKQPGALSDPVSWQINYPTSWQVSTALGKTESGKLTIETDLSTDKTLELTFTK